MEPASSDSQISSHSDLSQGNLAVATASTSPSAIDNSLAASPQAAQDLDLIEDEWVAAVKNVMHTYHNDPYSLAGALSELRRDYLSKRYDRNLKAAD